MRGGWIFFTKGLTRASTGRSRPAERNNMTWIAIGLGEVRRKEERFTTAVPSRQWTSRCRRPRKLFYIEILLIFPGMTFRVRKTLPCTAVEVEALFYLISNLYFTHYTILTLSIPFVTSWRCTVWEWHKRSMRVNTRLQRESAINTIQYLILTEQSTIYLVPEKGKNCYVSPVTVFIQEIMLLF